MNRNRRSFLKASGTALGALAVGSGTVTASDDNTTIWLVTTDRVDDDSSFSGTLSKMEAYFNEVMYGYSVYTYAGYNTDSSFDAYGPCDTVDWWSDQSFTDSDNNLLIDKADNGPDEGGCAVGDHAAVVTVYSGMGDMAGPSTDTHFIGDQAVTGYAAPMQVATALQEVAHLDIDTGSSTNEHKLGYAYEDSYVNKTSPMMAGYADSYSGDYNECWDTITYNSLKETRYVEGFTECAASHLDGSVKSYDANNFDSLSG